MFFHAIMTYQTKISAPILQNLTNYVCKVIKKNKKYQDPHPTRLKLAE